MGMEKKREGGGKEEGIWREEGGGGEGRGRGREEENERVCERDRNR